MALLSWTGLTTYTGCPDSRAEPADPSGGLSNAHAPFLDSRLSGFSLRMVGDWPGVTPPHNGFTRPRWARHSDRERDGKRVEGCRIETKTARGSKSEREWMREKESSEVQRVERVEDWARGWKTGWDEREEGNGSHIDFPMFPRIVTIAPGEGARRRQVPPSSTIPRHPPLDNHPRAASQPAFRSSKRWSPRWERDYVAGRAFPSGLSFLSFILPFYPCSLLHAAFGLAHFSTWSLLFYLAITPLFCCCHSSPWGSEIQRFLDYRQFFDITTRWVWRITWFSEAANDLQNICLYSFIRVFNTRKLLSKAASHCSEHEYNEYIIWGCVTNIEQFSFEYRGVFSREIWKIFRMKLSILIILLSISAW